MISNCEFSDLDSVSCVVKCTPESIFARLVGFTYSNNAFCLPINDILRTNCILPPPSNQGQRRLHWPHEQDICRLDRLDQLVQHNTAVPTNPSFVLQTQRVRRRVSLGRSNRTVPLKQLA